MSNGFFLPAAHPAERPPTNMHVMVDIETLGVHTEAPILTIGAVLFDPWQMDGAEALYSRAFIRKVAIQSSIQFCPKVDGDTLAWWLNQDDAALKALVGEDVISLKDALAAFRQYCVDRHPKTNDWFFNGHSAYPQGSMLWAKSPDFDCKILDHAFSVTKEINPWAFWQYRCVRTVQDLAWPEGPDTRPDFHAGVGVKHDARADAVAQALCVQAGYQQLGLSKPAQFSSY
jgi:exodeoxyribonuclease VIII